MRSLARASVAARRRSTSGTCERGSGTVSAAAMMLLLAFVLSLVMAIAVQLQMRHHAHAAADLGALAAAEAVWEGAGSVQACSRAQDVVAANQSVLDECVVDGMNVAVRAHVDRRTVFPEVSARAVAQADAL